MKRNGELESENLELKLKEIERRLKRIEELEGLSRIEESGGSRRTEKLEGLERAEILEELRRTEELDGLKRAVKPEELSWMEELEGLKHAEKLGVNMNPKNNHGKRGFQNTRNVSGSQSPAKETGLVEEIAKGFMPGLEKIIKRMEEVSPEFRVRIEETDQDIKHRLDKQWTFRPGISAGYSLDTVKGRRKAAELKIKPEIEPIFDIIKEKDYIYVTAQVPNEKECRIKTELDCNVLRIASGDYFQTMELPEKPGPIVEQTFRNGVLQLKLKRQKYVD